MSILKCRNATLNDWPQIKDLHARLQTDKARNYIASTIEELEAFLVNSITFPQVSLLVLEWEMEKGTYLVGIAAMMLIQAPQLGQIGVHNKLAVHCFIHAVYIPSWIRATTGEKLRVPLQHGVDGGSDQDAGALMWNSMVAWAEAHNASYIYGNIRLDGNFGAFEKKYGLTKRFTIIGKEIGNEVKHG